MPRIPFFGNFVGRNVNPASFTGSAQSFINCFPSIEKTELTREAKIFLNKRPGSSRTALASSGYAAQRPALIWTGSTAASLPVIFTFAKGSTGVEVWNLSTAAQIGSTITTSGATTVTTLTETLISSTSNLLLTLVDGGTQEAWFFPEGGAWTQITDGDFPVGAGLTLVGEPAHMDGYAFYMDTLGGISNSDLNSLSAYTAGNRVVAQSMPDGGVGVARLKNLIVAFGNFSIEFFHNAGNSSGSPLSPVGNAVRRIGANHNRSSSDPNRPIYACGDVIYFIGVNSETGARGLYRLQDFVPQKISNDSMDALLSSQTGAPSIVGVIRFTGQEHIVTDVTFGTNKQLCYSITNNFPWMFSHGDSAVMKGCVSGQWVTDGGQTASVYNTSAVSPVYADDSVAYTAQVQMGPIDIGTNKKKAWKSIDLVGLKETTSGNTSVSYSDDGGTNYTTWGNVDMSAPPCRLHRGGMSRRRIFRFSDAVNRPWRPEYFDIEADVCET